MLKLNGLLWAWLLGFGCGGCADCESVTQDANAYVNDSTNRTCKTDADCVAVLTGCMTLERGYCGQVALSRTAAKSSAWSKILDDAGDSCDSSCGVCAAELIPTCGKGLCGGGP